MFGEKSSKEWLSNARLAWLRFLALPTASMKPAATVGLMKRMKNCRIWSKNGRHWVGGVQQGRAIPCHTGRSCGDYIVMECNGSYWNGVSRTGLDLDGPALLESLGPFWYKEIEMGYEGFGSKGWLVHAGTLGGTSPCFDMNCWMERGMGLGMAGGKRGGSTQISRGALADC